jgi:hypothetical protein
LGFGARFWRTGYGHFKDMAKVVAGEQGTWKLANSDEIPYNLIRQWLGEGDVWRHPLAQLGHDHAERTWQLGAKLDNAFGLAQEQTISRSFRNAQNQLGHMMDKYNPLSIRRFEGKYNIENYATVNALMSQLDAGIPVGQALSSIRESLFSFSAMTDVERKWMRSLVPFWTFTSRAVPFIAKLSARRPAILGMTERIKDLALPTDEEEASIPQWVRDYPWVSMSRTPKGLKIMSLRNTFTIDILNDVIPKLDEKGVRNLVSQLNPLLVAPVEMAIGKEFYMSREIQDRRRIWRELKTPFMKNTLGWFLNARDVRYKDKDYVAVDGTKYHALRRLWFSRFFRELDSVSNIV